MSQLKTTAINAIKNKLLGKAINYSDAYAIMNCFSSGELGEIFVAYFTASSFKDGFSDEELYYLVKAMVETGERFDFKGMVVDKHSIGGLPGTRTTLIVTPIIAAAGFVIPKTSSRAITTPAGTADCMEILAPVNLTYKKIESVVNKTGGCIVWGGHLKIAPADDIIIKVEKPLSFESYDKIMISVLAKKIAMSSKYVVIDIPVGPTMKIKYIKDAIKFSERMKKLAGRFSINLVTDINYQLQPSGSGIGPVFETVDALKVLFQTTDRPLALEYKAIKLASQLLDLCYEKQNIKKDGQIVAEEILKSGKALLKFKEIIEAQGGNPDIKISDLNGARYVKDIRSNMSGKIQSVNNYNICTIAKMLGAPDQKAAGMVLNKRFDEEIKSNDILLTMYAEDRNKLDEAVSIIKKLPVYEL
jgi:AMP phosphorylase